MIIISFAKQQSCEFEKEKIPRWYTQNLWHKTKYDSIFQHAMVLLIQMVEGDC
jgi:uncharacterized membrane protein